MTSLDIDPVGRPEELWRWSATQLAHEIATGHISAREVVASYLDRIDAVNPPLTALVEVRPEEALGAAAVADEMVVRPRVGTAAWCSVGHEDQLRPGRLCHDQRRRGFRGRGLHVDSPQVAAFGIRVRCCWARNSPAFSYRWFRTTTCTGER